MLLLDMVSMKQKIVWLLVRQTLFAIFLTAVSLPLVQAFHRRFDLGAPPLWGLVLLGVTLLLGFAGAACIGVFVGQSNAFGYRAGRKVIIAALLASLWGLVLLGAAVPFYASTVVERLTNSGTSLIWQERNQIWTRGRDAWQRFNQGKGEEVARQAAQETLDKSKSVAYTGLAALPALGILLWVLIGAPLIGAWECRRASRF